MLFFVFESLTSTESNPPSHRIQNGTSLSFFFPSVARPSDGKKNTSLMTCSDEAQPVGRHATTNYTKSNLGPSVNLSFFLLSLAQCLLTMVATIFYKRMDTQSISVHHTRGYKRTYLKKKKNQMNCSCHRNRSANPLGQINRPLLLCITSAPFEVENENSRGRESVLSDVHVYHVEGVYTTCSVLHI